MDNEKIAARVRGIIAGNCGGEREPETPFTTLDSLGLDSLDRIEIAIEIENDPTCPADHIPDEDVERWKTVADVVRSASADASQETGR